MHEKDITEKILADYPDVFSDICNVLLFDGKEVISSKDVMATNTISQYKIENIIHEQERDVLKRIQILDEDVVMIGFEHQTEAEKFMPVRVIGYDGASYRGQLLNKDTETICPVITLVLYFGSTPWNYTYHLKDGMHCKKEYESYVHDYEIHVFSIAYLKPEQVKLFKSDFKYVAYYFVQMHMFNDYKPSPEHIVHIDEMLKLMAVVTGDHKFEQAAKEANKEEGESMETILDRVENRGIKIGEKRGRKQGRKQGNLEGKVTVYYQDMGLSTHQIAKKLNEPENKIRKIIKNLEKKN